MRSRASSCKCVDKNTNKLKGISKSFSKNIQLDEYKNCKKCLDGEGSQIECDNLILKSIDLEMYLGKMKKSPLSIFFEKSEVWFWKYVL